MNKSGEHTNTEHKAPGAAFDELFHKATAYAETRIELARLKTIDKSADAASSVYASSVTLVMGLLFVIMLSTGLALLLGEWLGKTYLGFFVVAGLYGLAGLVFYFNRDSWLKKPTNDRLIRKMLGNE